MESIPAKLGKNLAWYAFAVFGYFLYLGLVIKSGMFFRKETEQDKLQLSIGTGNLISQITWTLTRDHLARDRLWSIHKIVAGLSHRFFQLRNGLQLHYLTNRPDSAQCQISTKPLIILLHGFPDSCVVWRHLLESSSLKDTATVIAVDLPGFGGSDSFDSYGPNCVLEALTEFIVAMREEHNLTAEVDWTQAQSTGESQGNPVFIVGHDWGCVLAYRLAAEASCLADRFIVTNGPLVCVISVGLNQHLRLTQNLQVPLSLENKDRILESACKMIRTFLHAPLRNYHCLHKALNTVRPLLWQALLFSYIAAFHLPFFMVKYFGTAGSYAYFRAVHQASYGKDERSDFKAAESMACTLGPGPDECKPQSPDASTPAQCYGETVLVRASLPRPSSSIRRPTIATAPAPKNGTSPSKPSRPSTTSKWKTRALRTAWGSAVLRRASAVASSIISTRGP